MGKFLVRAALDYLRRYTPRNAGLDFYNGSVATGFSAAIKK